MYWSLKTGKLREKFEVSAEDNSAVPKVYLDCTQSDGSNVTTTVHYWLDIHYARELAAALVSAADYAEANCKKVQR
jgi:hypothetical protein